MELISATILFCVAAILSVYLVDVYMLDITLGWIFVAIMFSLSIYLFHKYKKK